MKLVGERRAIAAAVLGASFLFYLGSVVGDASGPLEIALTAGYGLAFLALVAGYKLARPVALAMLALGAARLGLDMIETGSDIVLVALALHAAAMVALLGRDNLSYIRLVGERRAVAGIILALYGLGYAMLARLGPVELSAMLNALATVYAIAFFALVAGYFWARWFGVGVALFGVIQGGLGLWQLGPEPVVVFMAVTHVIAVLALWGGAMALPYDGQTAWRERFHMDDNAVQRLGRSVIRAGVSLPMVLLYAFAPKPEAAGLLAFAAVALAAGGLGATIRMRTWGVLAMAASGALLVGLGGEHSLASGTFDLAPLLGGALLLAAGAPFARGIAAHLKASRSQSLAV